MLSAEEKVSAATDRISYYYNTHDHACETCMEDVLQDVHSILIGSDEEDGVEIKVQPPTTKGN